MVSCPMSKVASVAEVTYLEQDVADEIHRQAGQVLITSLWNVSYPAKKR